MDEHGSSGKVEDGSVEAIELEVVADEDEAEEIRRSVTASSMTVRFGWLATTCCMRCV